MNFFIMLILSLTLTMPASAYYDGTYRCASKNGNLEVFYSIETIDLNSILLPYLEVRTVEHQVNNEGKTSQKVYLLKGLAVQSKHETSGKEILLLQNITLELKGGRPTCALK